ncbi:hypothetical protein CHELA1G11_13801 [Hyphomicrobiales bacterium]|nr:hypothetical protein CHELA1G2_10514 [Hyphomicrobiales bacterium]CAH1674140.1 hypothetical protein CHELA1G11_13801 [Hyphomicrobiales bacterium]
MQCVGQMKAKTTSTSPPSWAPKSTGCSSLAKAAAGFARSSRWAWGMATPWLMAVEPRRSRALSAVRSLSLAMPVRRLRVAASASRAADLPRASNSSVMSSVLRKSIICTRSSMDAGGVHGSAAPFAVLLPVVKVNIRRFEWTGSRHDKQKPAQLRAAIVMAAGVSDSRWPKRSSPRRSGFDHRARR